jgi:BASS family bile acid:Na+ symporter
MADGNFLKKPCPVRPLVSAQQVMAKWCTPWCRRPSPIPNTPLEIFMPRDHDEKAARPASVISRIARSADRYLLVLLMLSYVMAAFLPAFGQAMRTTTALPVPLPVLLLAVLLFTAGLGMDRDQLRESLRLKWLVVTGQLALWGGPLVIVGVLGWASGLLPAGLLTGLALVGLMPAAASSVAWSQLSRGNVALSLGLLATSTLLSPFIIYAVGKSQLLASDGELISSANATVLSLIGWIIPAVVLGAGVRWWAGGDWAQTMRPYTKLISTVVLLLLNYANAAIALPGLLARPDWSSLAAVTATTAAMCSGGFLVGWLLTVAAGVGHAARRSFLFGIGMKNTGMALVLAGMWFPDLPWAIVAVILYTLIQHLLAAACRQQFRDPA